MNTINMTSEEQLELWVKGESVHNDEKDECCPDFSCCRPDSLADEDTRKRFQKAFLNGEKDAVREMLGMFLGGAFPKAYVAGLKTIEGRLI